MKRFKILLCFRLVNELQWFKQAAGINNLTGNQYYIRRASGYSGPEIIPSDGISFYGGAQFNIGKEN